MGTDGSSLQDRTRALVPTALTLLMLLAAVLAAGFLGPFSADPVMDAGISAPEQEPAPLPTASAGAESLPDEAERIEIDGGTLVAFVLLLAVAALALLVRFLRRFRPGPPEEARVSEQKDVGHEVTLNLAEQGLPAWVETARASLEGDTDTSEAVIRCWLELERLCAAAGMARRRVQTTSEFATAVSRSLELPPDPLTDLTSLYQRARFARSAGGTAPLQHGDRARAKAALDELTEVLDARRSRPDRTGAV